jgi:DNA-binding transcriptional LysR family regulator
MDNIDLKLLKVFEAIHRCASLSKAADRLGLSQPAVSQALARLRERFDDPLFVRTPQGMEPTPHANELLRMVTVAIAAIEDTMAFRPVFNAASSRRLFRIGVTDIGQIVLLPQLLPHLREQAPRVEVEALSISDQTGSMLETGEIDLAVGFIAQIDARFYQQALFDERFVCLARAGHPRIRDSMSLDAYVAEEHVVVTTSGTGHLVVDRTVERLKIERKVALRIPSFLALSTIVGSTDLLCTLPRRAGLIMARHGDVSVWDLPFELPAYTVRQHWHERQQYDPGCQWLRRTIAGLFGQGGPAALGPGADLKPRPRQ